jgi:hypothetical protein
MSDTWRLLRRPEYMMVNSKCCLYIRVDASQQRETRVGFTSTRPTNFPL